MEAEVDTLQQEALEQQQEVAEMLWMSVGCAFYLP